MAEKESQIVVSFTEGVTEGVAEEVAEGVVTRSENTRLTKLKGTVCRRPSEIVIGTMPGSPACGGMATGMRESVIAYLKPGPGQQRILDDQVQYLTDSATGFSGQNAYFPYPLVESGPIGAAIDTAPATCFDSEGRQWFATSQRTSEYYRALVMFVVDHDQDVVSRRIVHLQNKAMEWIGLTPCTGGVVVWYAGEAGIVYRKVTIVSGDSLSVGTEHALWTPHHSAESLDRTADVVSDGASTAWLICRHITPTDTVLLKIDLTAFTSINVGLINTVTDSGFPVHFALSYYNTGAGFRLAVASSDHSAACYRGVHNPTTLAANWGGTTFPGYGPVSALPYVQSGRDSVIFAVSLVGDEGVGVDKTQTMFEERTRQTGTVLSAIGVPWYCLQSRGVSHQISNTEIYPYFPLFPRWGLLGREQPALPTEPPSNCMDTPQCVVVTPYAPDSTGGVSVYTPVMRCGVDRLSMYSADQPFGSSMALSLDGRFNLVYIADRYDLPLLTKDPFYYESHRCVFDLAHSWQPATAADVGPVAVAAAGLVATWDGLQTTEYAPFTRPKIAVVPSGFGATLDGTYVYTAVVSWRDQAGNIRRSAPALPVTFDVTEGQVAVYVSYPLTMRNGVRQAPYSVDIYSTAAGGAILHATYARVITQEDALGCWLFDDFLPVELSSLQLYSLGGAYEPLTPECPPPAHDIRSIAGRLWLIDAENRYRLLPSLLKQQGIAFEFNSNLEIIGFDQQYGKLVAVVDVGGSPFVLAERGIWRVDGYGPDNAGQGGAFTDPQLVSNIGCRSRISVAQVPNVGVLFQCTDGRFALLTGSVQRFETFGVYEVGPPTIHLLESEVIYPLTDGSGSIVYNWLANGWTKWPTTTRPLTSSTTLLSHDHSRTYYYASDGSFLVMDSDSIDTQTVRPLRVERGWVAPAGPQGDCVIREFWVHVIYNTAHDVKVRAQFDYDTTQVVEETWTDAELTPLLQDGRYTIGMHCEARHVRAVRVHLEFTHHGVGEGGQPLTLTVLYGASTGIRRRTLGEGAIK